MVAVLDAVSVRLARQLSPTNRAGGGPTPPGTGELRTPTDERTPLEKENRQVEVEPASRRHRPDRRPGRRRISKKKPPRESRAAAGRDRAHRGPGRLEEEVSAGDGRPRHTVL